MNQAVKDGLIVALDIESPDDALAIFEDLCIPVQVNVDDIICPDWHGFIDTDDARLVFFEGLSA